MTPAISGSESGPALDVGDKVTLEVGRVAHGGHFIAHAHGVTIFVRGAITGESVIAEITHRTKKIAMAETVEVLRSSPHRVPAPCHYFRERVCGGCDFQHIDLNFQRELKAEIVRESFRRIAGVEVHVRCISAKADESGFHWRTRMDFTVTPDKRIALHPHRSNSLTEIDNCLLAHEGIKPEEINRSLAKMKVPAFERVRVGVDSRGESTLSGKVEMIVEEKIFPISLESFWQPHTDAASTLVRRALELLQVKEGESLLDLYGGVGLFTAFIRDLVGDSGRVTLIESDRSAIKDAKRIFATDTRVAIIEQKVEEALKGIERCDRILADPPRTGLGLRVLDEIDRLAPKQLLYISCDPATLARDAQGLMERGFSLDSVEAFDLFPMTEHIESVANFIRAIQ
jgi:tRNA/tmRNA/rRNA uracil-C5-methylase (TrmA/RlmC/RlmD family)